MTFGRVDRSLAVGDSVLSQTFHPAGLRLPAHDHPNASLTFILAGSYTEVFGQRALACEAGAVVLKPAGFRHANRYGSRNTLGMLFDFGPRFAGHIGAFSNALEDVWDVRGGPAANAMRELSRELHLSDAASPLIVEGCLWRVLGLAQRQAAPLGGRPTWVSQIEQLIREEGDQRWSLTQLAALAGVHPAHLNRVFRRHYGESVGAYLRRLRIERACQMLANSSLPLARVSLTAGFCDQSHFTRVFKLAIGTTPSVYRRRHAPIVPGCALHPSAAGETPV